MVLKNATADILGLGLSREGALDLTIVKENRLKFYSYQLQPNLWL